MDDDIFTILRFHFTILTFDIFTFTNNLSKVCRRKGFRFVVTFDLPSASNLVPQFVSRPRPSAQVRFFSFLFVKSKRQARVDKHFFISRCKIILSKGLVNRPIPEDFAVIDDRSPDLPTRPVYDFICRSYHLLVLVLYSFRNDFVLNFTLETKKCLGSVSAVNSPRRRFRRLGSLAAPSMRPSKTMCTVTDR